jgi:hypothetical protein
MQRAKTKNMIIGGALVSVISFRAGLWRGILATAVVAALMIGGRAVAAELVMFEKAGCPWCQAFDREIAPIYPLTMEGRRAPLRRVDVGKPSPPDLAFIVKERFTPVFVLIEDGREIDRIRGYPGEDHFWGLLNAMIGRLDRTYKGSGPAASQREMPLQRIN